MTEQNVSLSETESAIVVYALENYIESMQKMASEEHSGVAKFLMESNIQSATVALGKVQGILTR
jgi:hypothetical protein